MTDNKTVSFFFFLRDQKKKKKKINHHLAEVLLVHRDMKKTLKVIGMADLITFSFIWGCQFWQWLRGWIWDQPSMRMTRLIVLQEQRQKMSGNKKKDCWVNRTPKKTREKSWNENRHTYLNRSYLRNWGRGLKGRLAYIRKCYSVFSHEHRHKY